jgi:hypothetical protein
MGQQQDERRAQKQTERVDHLGDMTLLGDQRRRHDDQAVEGMTQSLSPAITGNPCPQLS